MTEEELRQMAWQEAAIAAEARMAAMRAPPEPPPFSPAPERGMSQGPPAPPPPTPAGPPYIESIEGPQKNPAEKGRRHYGPPAGLTQAEALDIVKNTPPSSPAPTGINSADGTTPVVGPNGTWDGAPTEAEKEVAAEQERRKGPEQEETYTPGSPGVLIPGGMRPHTEELDTKFAKGNAPGEHQANVLAMGLDARAAGVSRDANAKLFAEEKQAAQAKLLANDAAMAQHAQLQVARDAQVKARLAEIEVLNREATGKPEDLWSSGAAAGRLLGFFFSTIGAVTIATGGGSKGSLGAGLAMGMAGKFFNGLINDDIDAKLKARKSAGEQSKRQTDLLHLHMETMSDQGKAIDATKLAYYDNILQQMEAYKAEHRGNINEANYLTMQSDILDQRRQVEHALHTAETNDVAKKEVNKYAPPQVLGGSAGGRHLQDVGNTITLSDGTSWALGDGPQTDKAVERIKAMQKLAEVNTRILALRQKAYKLSPVTDHEDYTIVMSQLEDLGAQKAPLMSMALDGSTIRKDERDEIEKKNVKATEGLGIIGSNVPIWSKAQQRAADATLSSQSKLWQENQKIEASGAGARQVQRGYVHDEHGEKRPVARYTGRDARPTEHLPPDSFKPNDPSKRGAPTRGKPLSSRYESAPDFGMQKADPPKSGKKKKEK